MPHEALTSGAISRDANPFRTASSSTPRDIESPYTEDDAGEAEDESEKDYENLVITARNSASEFGYTIGVLNTSLNVLAKVSKVYFARLPIVPPFTFLTRANINRCSLI